MDQCTNVKHSVVVLLVLNVIMFQITLSNTDDSHTIVQHTATCVRDVTNCKKTSYLLLSITKRLNT